MYKMDLALNNLKRLIRHKTKPSGWAVYDLVALVATWLATLHFGPYWARQVVGEAQPNQLARHVKLSSKVLQKNFFVSFWIRK